MNPNRRRNSIELVELCAQSGATGRQSVDESTKPPLLPPSPRRKNRRKHRSPPPIAINDACRFAVRAYTPYFWSIVSYLFIFHRTAPPGAINRFSFVEGKIYIYIYGIPGERHSINFSWGGGNLRRNRASGRWKYFSTFRTKFLNSARVLVGLSKFRRFYQYFVF